MFEVIDLIYHTDEEPYIAFVGTHKACEDFIRDYGSDFGMEIRPQIGQKVFQIDV